MKSPRLFSLSILPFTLGCGGSPPALQAPAAGANAAPVVVTPQPVVDLSQVPDPQGLVVAGRIAKLSATFDVVHGWSKLPMPGAEQVTELLTSEAVGALADVDQPIDFAVSVTGKLTKMDVFAAVSAAVKDVDKAKAMLSERYKLVPTADGSVLIQGLGRPAHGDGDDDNGGGGGGDRKPAGEPQRTCELAPAFGLSATRLVCAWSNKALRDLAPWLTRTATRAQTTGDIHVDVLFKPLEGYIDQAMAFLPMGMAMLSGAGGLNLPGQSGVIEAALSDVANFARDIDVLSFDARMSDPGATMTATLKLAGTRSQIARMATARADRNGPAPAAFWQMPGDSDAAAFSRGMDESQVATMGTALQPVFDGLLDELDLKDADRKPIVAAVIKLLSGCAGVYASGVDGEAVHKALLALSARTQQADDATLLEAKHAATEAFVGWRVVEREEAVTRLQGALKDLAEAWNKPGVVAANRAKFPDAQVSFRSASLPKGLSLPAGSVHYVLEVALPGDTASSPPAPPVPRDKTKPGPKKSPRAKPVAVHMFAVPDGQRSWLAIAGEEGLAVSRLASSMGSAGDKLGSRADLAGMKQATSLGGAGFLTLRGLGESVAILDLLTGDSPSDALSVWEESQQLPHQALTAIPFSITPQPGSPGPVVWTFTLPKGSIEDVVTTVVKHGGF